VKELTGKVQALEQEKAMKNLVFEQLNQEIQALKAQNSGASAAQVKEMTAKIAQLEQEKQMTKTAMEQLA
jgi:archaellum component FlaC